MEIRNRMIQEFGGIQWFMEMSPARRMEWDTSPVLGPGSDLSGCQPEWYVVKIGPEPLIFLEFNPPWCFFLTSLWDIYIYIWGWCSLLTMIPVRSQWGRYNLPRYIYIYHYITPTSYDFRRCPEIGHPQDSNKKAGTTVLGMNIQHQVM